MLQGDALVEENVRHAIAIGEITGKRLELLSLLQHSQAPELSPKIPFWSEEATNEQEFYKEWSSYLVETFPISVWLRILLICLRDEFANPESDFRHHSTPASFKLLIEILHDGQTLMRRFEMEGFFYLSQRLAQLRKKEVSQNAMHCAIEKLTPINLDHSMYLVWKILFPEDPEQQANDLSRFLFDVVVCHAMATHQISFSKIVKALKEHSNEFLIELRKKLLPWIHNPAYHCLTPLNS